MRTSYFAKYKNVEGNAVSIALSTPSWYGKGKDWPKIEQYRDLCPTWTMLNKYKKSCNDGTDKEQREREYIEAYYNEVLSKLDPHKVYNDLKNKVLLCWEKAGEFCHRRIIAQWIYDELGILVEEMQ